MSGGVPALSSESSFGPVSCGVYRCSVLIWGNLALNAFSSSMRASCSACCPPWKKLTVTPERTPAAGAPAADPPEADGPPHAAARTPPIRTVLVARVFLRVAGMSGFIVLLLGSPQGNGRPGRRARIGGLT